MVGTRTQTHSRLPGGAPADSRGAEVVRGVLSLLAITLIAIGVPVALWLGFGPPWPSESPSGDWIYADITSRDVLAILIAVVWLAWLHFCICLVVEFVAERRNRGLAPHIPGGSVGTQPLARRLVGAVLLLSGGVAATVPAAAAAATSNGVHQVSADAAAPSTRGGGAAGEAEAPPGQDAHRDRTPAFTDRDAHGLHKYVEVQPPAGRHYDTLWGIAERYLGDGLRYKEIAALNRGVTQPDGTTLRDPDLIYPGWILKLPADAEGPGLRAARHDSQSAAPERSRGGAGTDDPGSRTSPERGDTETSPAGQDGDESTSLVTIGGFSTGGALLAAGLLLNLRRRRGWNGRPHPRGGKPLDHESDLRSSADESSAIFVDTVLRSLAQALPQGATLPAPTGAVLGVDGLALTFPAEARTRLDAPWSSDSGARTWLMKRTAAQTLRPEPGALSPLPGVVALGRRADDVETLIDVESIGGVLSISGDLGVARDIAVGLGLALATNRWSDSPRVTFVGFADDLSQLAPGQIRHFDELSAVFETVDAKRRRQHSACAASGFDSVRTGRLSNPDPRLWAPEFIVVSGVPDDADVRRLSDLAGDPRNAIGVIVVGDVKQSPARMVAATDGSLWCGPLGIDVVAHRVTADTYRDALSVFDAELAHGGDGDDPDDPAGAARAVPVVDPDALELETRMPVQITSLGHLSVTAPGELEEARRDLLTELVVYLALHPDGTHPNVLSAAIWPRGVSDEVRDSALAQAATWLGVDASRTPRLSIDAAGRWRLGRSGVRFDWDVFRALANRAAAAADPTRDLEQALTLATGQAWTGLPTGHYGWLAYETVEADVRVAVVAVARRLAELAAAAGDPMRARTALLAGLRTAPACEDIWRDALTLANRFAGPADVRLVADDMYAALARHGSPRGPEPETDALVDELLPGYRKVSAA
ncbi:MAG TPA: LysM peptidoglycan-binding domain-containing protein [Nocardioidaceae bacterium]